ncbi:MAG: hypothetical protein R3B72_06455 [Polyangiaceae bacterium]
MRFAWLTTTLPLIALWLAGPSGCNALFGVDELRYESAAAGGGAAGASGTGGRGGAGGEGGALLGGGGAGDGGAGGSPAPAPKAITFQGNAAQNGLATSFSFNVVIGTPAPDRRVIVGIVMSQSGRDIAGVTVDGMPATILGQITGDNAHTTGLAIAHVPDGTTADIVVQASGSEGRAGIGVWSATGLTSDTPISLASSIASKTKVTLSTTPGGFAVGMAGHVAPDVPSWLDLQQRFQDRVDGHSSRYTGADDVTNGGSLDVEVTGLSDIRRGLVAASF